MLESLIHQELYDQLANYSWTYNDQPVSVQVLRARQVVESISYPAIFIDYSDAVLDRTNTPINEIISIDLVQADDGYQDIQYSKGVVVRQSVDLSLYDNNIRRIAKLQNDLFVLCKKLNLSGVTVFDVNPPRVLDFAEEDYVYRRLVEVIFKFVVSYEEIIKTIEEVETSIEAH